MAPEDRAPPNQTQNAQTASGRPFGVRAVTYAEAAERLLDNGYAPLPVVPGTKRPPVPQWTKLAIDAAFVAEQVRRCPTFGVGLRTGALVGIDIDHLDPDLGQAAFALAVARLGPGLVRIGRWPKRTLIYRTEQPFRHFATPNLEVLGLGRQMVAYGIHPDTRQPYYWLDESPLDVPLCDLPLVDEAGCAALVADVSQLLPPDGAQRAAHRRPVDGVQRAAAGPLFDEDGRVVDGRDSWLSRIAYHAIHDAVDIGGELAVAAIAATAWSRFEARADLVRPKADGRPYGPADATRKVADKLRLLRDGGLPLRAAEAVAAPDLPEALPVEEARARLEATLADACRDVLAWHTGEALGSAPQIGVKATVGLGKTTAARRRLVALRNALAAAEKPARILILTPSLALADETAAAWRDAGERVAVLRGYERQHPTLHRPMCANIPAVKAATEAGVDVHTTACLAPSGNRCTRFEGCLKQAIRTEVADADVVVAAYDALFTGFAVGAEGVGLIGIDEGCWARAHEALEGLAVETFAMGDLNVQTRSRKPEAFDAAVDLHELRARAVQAFAANGAGALQRRHLVEAGLSATDAQLAARLERARMRDPGLYPGMPSDALDAAMRQVAVNARSWLYVAAWEAMAGLRAGEAEADGRLEVGAPDRKTGLRPITVRRLKPVHPTLRGKPVLHLDATLRLALARTILPELEVTEIAADAPHMQLRLVTGPFGKRSLCDSAGAGTAERRRRANRLRECVDYVRWHARRFARTLVVTYKDVEAAFEEIPGVEAAHFNAIAGLDLWRDVGLLVVVGRPLPGTDDLARSCGGLFGHAPQGGYRKAPKGILMRSGLVRTVRATTHDDPLAETLRAAICDDEVIQAIGRGRGVNRSAADPLEVHVLADVALPLVHDRLSTWDLECPDVVQRMLLAGVAVDSPADAATLHPALFINAEAAKKALQRALFGGHSPIRNTYREMSPKSAAYRRPGRGRSWQRAYWIAADAADAKAALACAVGPLAEWRPG